MMSHLVTSRISSESPRLRPRTMPRQTISRVTKSTQLIGTAPKKLWDQVTKLFNQLIKFGGATGRSYLHIGKSGVFINRSPQLFEVSQGDEMGLSVQD